MTDGLVFYVDAANDNSYPGSGTTWTDLIEGVDGSFEPTLGPVYDSANGGSIVFDGTDDYVDYDNLIPCPNIISMNGWFKQQQTGVAVMVASSHGATRQQWQFKINSLNEFVVPIRTGASFSTTKTTTTVSSGTWTHIAATYDGTTVKMYINGALDTTNSSGPSGNIVDAGLNMELLVGARDATTPKQFANGNVACFSIYNRALTASEVLQNYSALKNRFI